MRRRSHVSNCDSYQPTSQLHMVQNPANSRMGKVGLLQGVSLRDSRETQSSFPRALRGDKKTGGQKVKKQRGFPAALPFVYPLAFALGQCLGQRDGQPHSAPRTAPLPVAVPSSASYATPHRVRNFLSGCLDPMLASLELCWMLPGSGSMGSCSVHTTARLPLDSSWILARSTVPLPPAGLLASWCWCCCCPVSLVLFCWVHRAELQERLPLGHWLLPLGSLLLPGFTVMGRLCSLAALLWLSGHPISI
jgi:hypothetical protein